MAALIDVYGLDIRSRSHPGAWGTGSSEREYILAGEWFGKVYVDYIAEQLEKQSPCP